jgi:hypothetical protein
MSIIIAAAQCAAPLGQIVYGVLFEKMSNALYIPVLFVSAAMFAFVFLSRHILKNEGEV